MDSDLSRLLLAWEKWDAHPSHDVLAVAMEAACAKVAERLGMTTTELRIYLSQARRQGSSFTAILYVIEGSL